MARSLRHKKRASVKELVGMTDKPTLKLSGTDGNAFAVIGKARSVGKQACWSEDKIQRFTKEAMSGDYDKVLTTCMKHFEVK